MRLFLVERDLFYRNVYGAIFTKKIIAADYDEKFNLYYLCKNKEILFTMEELEERYFVTDCIDKAVAEIKKRGG